MSDKETQSRTDLGCHLSLLGDGRVKVYQDGYKEQTFTRAELTAALENETDFVRALALQEAMDFLARPLCVCLEHINDNGPCPVHGGRDEG